MTRLPVVKPDDLDGARRELYDRIAGGPRASGPQLFALTDVDGGLHGPFNAMLYAPRVGDALQSLGAAIRYGSSLGDRVREIAILAVAGHADSDFERYAHEAIGRAIGLDDALLAALRSGAEVALDDPAERAALATVRALLRTGDLDDAEYDAARAVLGEPAIVELTTLVGYYAMLAAATAGVPGRRAGRRLRPHTGPMSEPSLLQRLSLVDAASLCDAGPGLRVLPSQLRPVAPGARLIGRAVTADAAEDLMSVLGALSLAGPGDVLVVATGGSRLAVAGELFATEAVRRGLAGLVIDGYCRDVSTLLRLPLPVFARGAHPRAAGARAVPRVQVSVHIGDIRVDPGDILVGDDDGIVLGRPEELAAALPGAEAIHARETELRAALAFGCVPVRPAELHRARGPPHRRRGEPPRLQLSAAFSEHPERPAPGEVGDDGQFDAVRGVPGHERGHGVVEGAGPLGAHPLTGERGPTVERLHVLPHRLPQRPGRRGGPAHLDPEPPVGQLRRQVHGPVLLVRRVGPDEPDQLGAPGDGAAGEVQQDQEPALAQQPGEQRQGGGAVHPVQALARGDEVVRRVQPGPLHRCDVPAQARVAAVGQPAPVLDHRRRDVDRVHADAERGQVPGHAARTAADVEDPPPTAADRSQQAGHDLERLGRIGRPVGVGGGDRGLGEGTTVVHSSTSDMIQRCQLRCFTRCSGWRATWVMNRARSRTRGSSASCSASTRARNGLSTTWRTSGA